MHTSSDAPELKASLTLIEAAFFGRHPSVVAPALLGCVLASEVDGRFVAGRIVETEAYLGQDDAGSHAATHAMTPRNSVMYGAPGTAFVYFTYGNHHMINLVCQPEGIAGVVLIRALEPLAGVDVMTARRHGRALRELCSGPGKLAQALGIDLTDNATVLGSGRLSVYQGAPPAKSEVSVSGRVGLTRGYELDLRYFMNHSPFVSRGRTGPPRPARPVSSGRKDHT